jgi:FAD/FMN-containing dehydrogenase
MKIQYRQTWKNHFGNQRIEPLKLCEPETVADVVALVQEAERCHCTVRAVGSGHSWSDVALSAGFLLKTNSLSSVLDVEAALLRPEVRETLVRVGGGIRLHELNTHLDAQGLALSNMGGYDGQTVAGVISTSTHGSGMTFGPLSEQVRSLDLVAGGGTVYRIEPQNGPTDPAAFNACYPGPRLVQDDDWFNAVVVSMGCMGVITAVTIAVEPKYWLKEVRTVRTWSQVKADLKAGAVLRDNLHYEFLFNPYAVGGEHRCLVTTRNKTAVPHDKPKDKLERHPLEELFSSLPITAKILNFLFDMKPEITPQRIDRAMGIIADDEFTSLSYKVMNIGAANNLPAFSAEIGVPLAGDRYIDAVERIMVVAEERARVGKVYETAPISVRFVKASNAFLSMMHGRDTAMLELIMVEDTEGGFELLGTYEEALYALDGRPHWGQVNYLTPQVRSMYPSFENWLKVRQQLDPKGTFAGPFTKRVGISDRGFLIP